MKSSSENEQRSGRAILLIVILAVLGLAIYVIWRLDSAPRTDDAYVYADTISVTPEISGRIVELDVHDNQAVKQGDVLFKIDPRPFQKSFSKATAALNALDNEIALTQRSVNAQKLSAAAAKANVERARAAEEQATSTLNRMEPLLSQGYVSPEQVDQARTTQRSAQAQLNTANLEARRAMAAISGVDALVAKRETYKADIGMAELNLEYTTVRATFDGRVIGLKTSTGQYASAGHSIFTLANVSHWYVVANFRETELEHIKPGDSAKVYLLSKPSRSFSGTVESIGYGVYPDDGGGETSGLPHVPRSINWVRVAQRFPVRILIDNPDPEVFRIGTSAVATLAGEARTSIR